MAGNCSSAITVSLQTSAGAPIATSTDLAISLSTFGIGKFYADAGCNSGAVTQIMLPSGTSSARFYFKAASAQQTAVTVSAPSLLRAGQSMTTN
jgi:hypothetical protein